MSAVAPSESQPAVLIVASPSSDWTPVAERHTHDEKDVVVFFTRDEGATLVSAVRARIGALAATGTALVAIACVGVLEIDGLRELAQLAGLRMV